MIELSPEIYRAARQSMLEIAAMLEREAQHYPECCLYHDEKAVFRYKNLTIRTAPSRPAILKVAEKYRKNKAPQYVRDPDTGQLHAGSPFSMRRAFTELKVVGPYNWRNCAQLKSKNL